jgi:hypothetical protein
MAEARYETSAIGFFFARTGAMKRLLSVDCRVSGAGCARWYVSPLRWVIDRLENSIGGLGLLRKKSVIFSDAVFR